MSKCEMILLAILAAAAGPLGAGSNVWTSHGPGGGQIQAVAINPKNPSTVYAAAFYGGVFKSTDGGANWNPASSGLKLNFISALVVDPQNPSTVYAVGGPLFKTTDGAQNWIAVSPPGGASSLALDPQNPSTLYAGGGRGVSKSTDGGKTWSVASAGLWCGGWCGGFATIVALDPQNPKIVYAALGGFPGGVFKSTDGGATWNAPLTQALIRASQSSTGTCDDWGYYFAQVMGRDAPAPEDISCLPPGGSRDQLISADQYVAELQTYAARHPFTQGNVGLIAGATGLVVDPQNPGVLYGAASGAGIVKSTDGGVSWNAANSGLSGLGSNQWIVAIDSKNPGTLYTTAGGPLFKSTDGAVSWNVASSGLRIAAIALDPQNPSTLFFATSEGVFKSGDGGTNWGPMNSGLAASNVGSLAVDPQNRGTVFAATSCCGGTGLFKSADGGTTWNKTGLSAAYFIRILAIDSQNPATLYAQAVDNPGTRAPGSTAGIFKSTDGGATWADAGWTQNINQLVIGPQDPNTLYATNATLGAGILQSTDGGATWSAANSGLPVSSSNPPSIGFGFLTLDPQSPNTLYVYASPTSSPSSVTSQLFRTTDGAGSWSAVSLGWDPSLFHLGVLAADPQNPGTLYAGTTVFDCEDFDVCPFDYYTRLAATSGPGLFKSTDGGNTWAKLDALDATAGGVVGLVIDPKNPATLYAVLGLYFGQAVLRSTDGGASWKALSSGLAGFVNSVAVDAQDPSTVYAATSGGGVFSITLASQ